MRYDENFKKRFSAVFAVLFFSWFLYMCIGSAYLNYEIITNHSVGTASIEGKSFSGHGSYDYTYFVDDKIYSGTSRLDYHDKKYLNPNNLNEVPVYYSKDDPDTSLLYIPDAVIETIPFVYIVGGLWLYFFVISICPNDIRERFKVNRRVIAFVILIFLSWQLYGDIVDTYQKYKIMFNKSVGTATITGKEYWFGYSDTYNYKFTANGIEYTGTGRIDDADEKSPTDVGPGSTVTVYYSEDNPSISLLHQPDPFIYLISLIMFMGWISCLIIIIDSDRFSVIQKIRESRKLKIRLIGTISLLILSWLLFIFGMLLLSHYEFINNHSVGSATILSKDIDGRFNYRFMVDSKEYTGKSYYDEDQSVYPASRTVKVYYYNNKPEVSLLHLPEPASLRLFLIFIFIVWIAGLVTTIYPSLWLKLIKKKRRHSDEKATDIIPDNTIPHTTQMGELINFQLLIKGKCPFDAPSAKKIFVEIFNEIKNSDYYTAIEEIKPVRLSLHMIPYHGEYTIRWPITCSYLVGVKFNRALIEALDQNGFTVDKFALDNENEQNEERKLFQIKITGKYTIGDMSDPANAIANAAVEILDENQYGVEDQEWRKFSVSTSSNNSFILKWPILCKNSMIDIFKLDLVDNLIKHGFIIKKSKITLKKEIKPFWKLWRCF